MPDPIARHLLESTLLCISIGSLTYCLRGQSAAARHSVWLISTVKFLIPTVLLSATGAQIASILPANAWFSLLAAKLLAQLAALFQILGLHSESANAIFESLWFLTIWIVGSGVMFGIWLSRWQRNSGRRSIPLSEESTALHRAKLRLHFQGTIVLRCSPPQNVPAVAGFFRHVLLIPQGLSEQLTEAEFEAVLMHELAHAGRRDNLASAFVHCLLCIFWFHPLLWFVEKQLVAERERAFDEMVIDGGVRPDVYLAGIAKVCRFNLFGGVPE